MATATLTEAKTPLVGEVHFQKPVLDAVNNCLTMCGVTAKCVGVSSVPLHDGGLVTGVIGVHGKVSGFVTVSLGERFALRAVEGLLQDRYETLTSQVVDGVGEITNIIVGGIKSGLSNGPWGFSQITVPSVIVGRGYRFAFGRGISFLGMLFEHQDTEALHLDDRLLQVTMSVLKL